ncbi:MAG TPA: hypothetical protein VGJ92_10295, partial [Methanocella sp.]
MIFILALIMAVSGCCCCCDLTPDPTPGGGDNLPSGTIYSNYYQNDQGPSAEDIQKSSGAISKAADSLDSGDKAAFLECLTNEAKPGYSQGEMSADGAKKLATAIRNAKMVKQYSNEIVYETIINGESLYFSTTKEGGQW